MKKRLVALFMVGMLSFSMLAGCGGQSSEKEEDEAVTVEAMEEGGEVAQAAASESAPEVSAESVAVMTDNNETDSSASVDDNDEPILFDVSELDKFVENYKDRSIKLFDSENSGNFQYKFVNIYNSDWMEPDLFVATSVDYVNNRYPTRNMERNFAISTYHVSDLDRNSPERRDIQHFYNIVLPISVTVANNENGGDYWTDQYEVSYKIGGNQLCIKTEGYVSKIGKTLETVNVYDINFYKVAGSSNGLTDSDNAHNVLSMKMGASIDYAMNTYRITYNGVPNAFPGEEEATYNAKYEYYTRDCNGSFSSDDVYNTFDEAYQAYINEVIQMQYGDLAYRVKIVHKDDVEANLEGVDNTVYELYRNNIDASSIFEGNECFFVDVDGDGTPELVAYLGNRIPLMYYIDTDGNVQSDGITGVIEGKGKICCSYSEGDGWGVGFSRLENGQLISEYSIYIGGDIMNPTLANYYHDGVCDEVSEQEAESLSNTDAYTDLWNYTSYSSLLDAWEAYNN